MKDWTGTITSTFKTIGASNHTDKEREHNDYYATEPRAAELLCDLFQFSPYIWECACGAGHLAKVFEKRGYLVKATDLIDRGYGEGGIDFLKCDRPFAGDIITNPPFVPIIIRPLQTTCCLTRNISTLPFYSPGISVFTAVPPV